MRELIWEIRAILTLLALRFVLSIAPETWEAPVEAADQMLFCSFRQRPNPHRVARLRKLAAEKEN